MADDGLGSRKKSLVVGVALVLPVVLVAIGCAVAKYGLVSCALGAGLTALAVAASFGVVFIINSFG